MRKKANAAGVPVATFLRSTALFFPIPRVARRPTSNHGEVALLLGKIGQLATAFRSASALADGQAVETALRDLSELRLLCFNPGRSGCRSPAIVETPAERLPSAAR
jgi:hypothetical protein